MLRTREQGEHKWPGIVDPMHTLGQRSGRKFGELDEGTHACLQLGNGIMDLGLLLLFAGAHLFMMARSSDALCCLLHMPCFAEKGMPCYFEKGEGQAANAATGHLIRVGSEKLLVTLAAG